MGKNNEIEEIKDREYVSDEHPHNEIILGLNSGGETIMKNRGKVDIVQTQKYSLSPPKTFIFILTEEGKFPLSKEGHNTFSVQLPLSPRS